MAAEGVLDNTELFEELDAYPWHTDLEFQAGLRAILGPKPSSSQAFDLTIRAKCFYFARKKDTTVDFDAYKTHLSIQPRTQQDPVPVPNVPEQSTAQKTSTPGPAPTYPTPFADIIALIQSGAPIPGIRDIPPTVLTSQATKPTKERRRKPWEKDGEENVSEGMFGDRRDEVVVQEEPEDVILGSS